MSLETSIIFAFLAMICWGFGDFFIQKTTRKLGCIESLALIGIVGTVGLFPLVVNEMNLLFYPSNFLLLVFIGVVTFIMGLCDFEALKEGKISIIDVIIEIELPVTIVLGFIFFKETLSLEQFFVISLIFIGIILIAIKSFSRKIIKLERGVLIAVFAAIGMGLINFLTAAGSKSISPVMVVWTPWFVFTILCLVVIIRREGLHKLISNSKKFKVLILEMGIFDTLAWLFYALAVLKTEISITTAITESYPAIALALGVLINKEKINWYQYFGGGLALAACFALAFLI
jgi:drug/metabolite transporter (DMT)-like permease